MLSDQGIRDRLDTREIVIGGFKEDCLTPVGYDLRVGAKAFSWKKLCKIDVSDSDPLRIEPQDTVIIETFESIDLSRRVSGTLHAMATHSLRRGLSHISTTVDPGWTGKLLVSLHNNLDTCVELQVEETFCTICFYEVQSEAQKDVRRAPGRTDIWVELLDRAKDERERLDKEQKRQKRNREELENRRRIFYAFILLLVLAAGFVGYFFWEPEKGALLMSGITAGVVLFPEILKSRKD